MSKLKWVTVALLGALVAGCSESNDASPGGGGSGATGGSGGGSGATGGSGRCGCSGCAAARRGGCAVGSRDCPHADGGRLATSASNAAPIPRRNLML